MAGLFKYRISPKSFSEFIFSLKHGSPPPVAITALSPLKVVIKRVSSSLNLSSPIVLKISFTEILKAS